MPTGWDGRRSSAIALPLRTISISSPESTRLITLEKWRDTSVAVMRTMPTNVSDKSDYFWPGYRNMRQVGSQRNGQEQVEALVRLLLEPVGRRQRQKVIALLDHEARSVLLTAEPGTIMEPVARQAQRRALERFDGRHSDDQSATYPRATQGSFGEPTSPPLPATG